MRWLNLFLLIVSTLLFEAKGNVATTWSVANVASNYTVSATDCLIFVNSQSNPVSVTLPSTTAFGQTGRVIVVKDVGAHATVNPIRIFPVGGDKIGLLPGPWVLSVNGTGILLFSNGAGVWEAAHS